MKRYRLDLASKKFWLFPIVALFAFGCATQPPATSATPETTAADTYLVNALNTKQAFLANWKVSPDFAAPASPLKATAKVLLSPAGRVESATLVDSSGNSNFDASVQSALARVKFIRPFEPVVTAEQRTFLIHFELKPKAP